MLRSLYLWLVGTLLIAAGLGGQLIEAGAGAMSVVAAGVCVFGALMLHGRLLHGRLHRQRMFTEFAELRMRHEQPAAGGTAHLAMVLTVHHVPERAAPGTDPLLSFAVQLTHNTQVLPIESALTILTSAVQDLQAHDKRRTAGQN